MQLRGGSFTDEQGINLYWTLLYRCKHKKFAVCKSLYEDLFYEIPYIYKNKTFHLKGSFTENGWLDLKNSGYMKLATIVKIQYL
jgi:hypothetical protein